MLYLSNIIVGDIELDEASALADVIVQRGDLVAVQAIQTYIDIYSRR